MRLTITQTPDNIFTVEVDESMEFENLQALLELESSIPSGSQVLQHNGRPLIASPQKSIRDLGIKPDDMLYLHAAQPPALPPRQPTDASAESLRRRVLNTPALLRQLTDSEPELARAAHTNPDEFARIIHTLSAQRTHDGDPFDVDSQARIEEAIRQENVLRNMEAALELNPESFAQVTMLYINVEVNSTPVKAFVDSGAQATIMSPECAERCGIMRLLDRRFAGIAKGVGTARILGRVHSAQMRVGSQFLVCSFTVMEGKGVDLLFGLDMLKRHQANIDLARNALVINGEAIGFLPEHEIPKLELESAPPHQEDAESSSAPPQSPSKGKYPEDTVQTLISFGVSREQAVAALDAAAGDPDTAAGLLFP